MLPRAPLKRLTSLLTNSIYHKRSFIKEKKQELASLLDKSDTFGTHILLDNNNWNFKTIPISNCKDAAIYYLKKGFTCVWFGQRVEINGRHKEALSKELEESLKKAKQWSRG